MDVVQIADFAPIGVVNAALAQWPDASWSHWHRYSGAHGDKYASKDPMRLPASCQQLINLMSQFDMPDDACFPDFDLHGAGMHWIPEGGRLPRHKDAEVHPVKGWRRRFNAILYLNECRGGELRFDEGPVVAPKANLFVMFPVLYPHEVLPVTEGDRKSLSLFWWDTVPCQGSTCSDFASKSSK